MKKVIGIAVLCLCAMSGSECAVDAETNSPGGVRSLAGPWMACIPKEILDEGNRVEKICRERLVLTDELAKIKKEFETAADRAKDEKLVQGGTMQGVIIILEKGKMTESGPDGYHAPFGVMETNVYLICDLLRSENVGVRRSSVAYMRRVARWAATRLTDTESRDWQGVNAGKYEPAWFAEILDPLVKRSMFDSDDLTRREAIGVLMRNEKGIRVVAEIAGRLGMTEWSMEWWLVIYDSHYKGLIPNEMQEKVRTKAEEIRQASLKRMREIEAEGERATKEWEQWLQWYKDGKLDLVPEQERERVTNHVERVERERLRREKQGTKRRGAEGGSPVARKDALRLREASRTGITSVVGTVTNTIGTNGVTEGRSQ